MSNREIMMDMFGYGHGWGMGSGMGFFAILFWVIIIAAAIFIVKGFVTPKNNFPSPPHNETPLSILEKRFAKGEIDEETFKSMKKQLTENESEQY